jgi:hypothetical protein
VLSKYLWDSPASLQNITPCGGARAEVAVNATKRAAPISPTAREQELLASLRSVIGERVGSTGKAPKETPERQTKSEAKTAFSLWQFTFILALAVDISLAYDFVLDVFPGLEKNSVIPRLAQLLPIVGGTLLVSYFEQIRIWVLGLTAKRSFGLTFVVLLPVLLVSQLHFYALFVDLHPPTTPAYILDKDKLTDAKFSDDKHHFLKLDKPSTYSVEVGNPSSVYQITPGQVVKGTLARLLGFGFSPLRLDELHEVTAYSPKAEGRVGVLAPDTPAMRISKLERSHEPMPDKRPGTITYSWNIHFVNDQSPSIHVPAGTYDFVLSVDGYKCEPKSQTIPDDDGASVNIDFHGACRAQ